MDVVSNLAACCGVFLQAMSDPIPNPPTSLSARSTLRGDGLMHGGEKGVVVKGFNEIGDSAALHCCVSHRVLVGCRNYDDARLGQNDLELFLDLEAAHT